MATKRKRTVRKYGYVDASIKSTAPEKKNEKPDINVNVIEVDKKGSHHKGGEHYTSGMTKEQSKNLTKETQGKLALSEHSANYVRSLDSKDENKKKDVGSSTLGETEAGHATRFYNTKRKIAKRIFARRNTLVKTATGEYGEKERDTNSYSAIKEVSKNGQLRKAVIKTYRPDGYGGYTKSKSKIKINPDEKGFMKKIGDPVDAKKQLYSRSRQGKRPIVKANEARSDTYRPKYKAIENTSRRRTAEDLFVAGGTYKVRSYKDRWNSLDKDSMKIRNLAAKKRAKKDEK